MTEDAEERQGCLRPLAAEVSAPSVATTIPERLIALPEMVASSESPPEGFPLMVADPPCPPVPVPSDSVVTVTRNPTTNNTIPRKTIGRRISPVLLFFGLPILGLFDVRFPSDNDI